MRMGVSITYCNEKSQVKLTNGVSFATMGLTLPVLDRWVRGGNEKTRSGRVLVRGVAGKEKS